jgi:hypothetical protein
MKTAVEHVKRFYSGYTPWISLGLGVLTRVLSKKSVEFAPRALAILALAWLIPVAISRYLRAPVDPALEPSWRRVSRTLAPTVTVLLYKNVLFFLVPVWFGSAHLGSLNLGFPVLLALMALFTCFADQYQALVLDRPRVRVAWTAVVLFAVLVPAVAVMFHVSPRTALVSSALLASTLSYLALAPLDRVLTRKGIVGMTRVTVPVAVVAGLLAPLFPPVPMVCHDSKVGTSIVAREIQGEASHFPRGTHRVVAWFAVTLPRHNQQEIAYQWFHDGDPVGPPFRTKVAGGRKEGFRTWTLKTAPSPGKWRVDMLTSEANQLIARAGFIVDP